MLSPKETKTKSSRTFRLRVFSQCRSFTKAAWRCAVTGRDTTRQHTGIAIKIMLAKNQTFWIPKQVSPSNAIFLRTTQGKNTNFDDPPLIFFRTKFSQSLKQWFRTKNQLSQIEKQTLRKQRHLALISLSNQRNNSTKNTPPKHPV